MLSLPLRANSDLNEITCALRTSIASCGLCPCSSPTGAVKSDPTCPLASTTCGSLAGSKLGPEFCGTGFAFVCKKVPGMPGERCRPCEASPSTGIGALCPDASSAELWIPGTTLGAG